MDHDNPVPCFPIRWSCMAFSPGASGSQARELIHRGDKIGERGPAPALGSDDDASIPVSNESARHVGHFPVAIF